MTPQEPDELKAKYYEALKRVEDLNPFIELVNTLDELSKEGRINNMRRVLVVFSDQLLLKARRDELAIIHQILQKPKDYDQRDTAQQQVWVILSLGEVGSHLDNRVAELNKEIE